MAEDRATFHAKITADARDFIDQTNQASAALAALIAQSSKVATAKVGSSGGSNPESEVKSLGAAMRADADKTTKLVQENIQQENKLRREGLRVSGSTARGSSEFVGPATTPTRLAGPVRDAAQGAADLSKLTVGYKSLSSSVNGYNANLSLAEKSARRLVDIQAKPTTSRSRLEGPSRDLADQARLIAGMKEIRRERDLEKAQIQGILEDRRRTSAAEAASARVQQRQMDAMVTGRYALYDLSQAYQTVGMSALKFLGLFKSTIQTAAEFETAFTSVEGAIRPLPGEVDALKESLVNLTREIPVAFTQIAEIATLGAQMGVAAKDIEGFTKTVASFSAVTGASVNTTAEAFGRISSLADVPVSEFENLASAVTYAGVNAVATEEQILSLTQSIAASSRQAGFSADEIVGLATALSSLGIAPEQARGVLLRVFGQIGLEIDNASSKLEVFSNISGMSAEEITSSWGVDPNRFFGAFLEGLSRAENQTAAFKAAGFVDTREINVLQRLSGDIDLYNDSIADSVRAYSDASYLGERYALTADNLASKLIILQNNIKAFSDSIGSAMKGPLGTIVDVLSFIIVKISQFASTPLGGFVTAFSAVAAALVAGFGLITSMSFKATAQLFAMRTAMIQMGRAGQNASGGIMALTNTMLGNVRMVEISTVVNGKNIISTEFMTKAQARNAGALTAWTAAANTATIAGRGLTTAIRILGLASGVLTAITFVGIAAEMAGIGAEAKKLEGFDFAGVSEAVKQDTIALRQGGKAYATFGTIVSGNNEVMGRSVIAQGNSALAVGISTDAIDENTIAFGENTRAALINALANNKGVQETFESYKAAGRDLTDVLAKAGGSWEELAQAALEDPGQGASNYIKKLIPEITSDLDAAQNNITGGWLDFTNGLRFDFRGDELKEIADITTMIDKSSGALKAGSNYASLWGGTLTGEINGVDNALNGLIPDVETLESKVASSFDQINKDIALEESIDNFGLALKKNGNDFSVYTESGRTNIEALQGIINGYSVAASGDTQMLADNLVLLEATMIAMGINSEVAMLMVRNAILKTGETGEAVSEEALAALIAKLNGVTVSSGTAKTALEKLNDALDKTFRKLDRKIDFRDSLNSLRDSLLENGSNFSVFSEAGRKNIDAVRSTIDGLAEASNGDSRKFSSSLNAMKQAMLDAGLRGTRAVTLINKAIKASGSNAKASAGQVRQFASALNVIDAGNVIAASNAIDNLSESVMSYLNASWMLGNLQLEIASGWESIANEASAAKDEIEDISDEIAKFGADRAILEYQLGIAIKYGDTLRANELRAEIAQLNAEEQSAIAANNQAIQEASQGATPQADLLAQQQALQNMVGYYITMGSAEVISAKNKKEAKQTIKDTVQAFKDQAVEAGVSEENVARYAKELRKGLKLARELNKPAEYKIDARTQKALTDIKNFRDQANAMINSIKTNVVVRVTTVNAAAGYASGGLIRGPGSSTSDSIPANLSNGEFVMKASAVSTYGVDFMNAINQMKVSSPARPTFQAASTSGSSVVYLSPEDRSLLRAAIDRPINLYSDSTKIAQTANQGNVILAQRGIN